MEDRQERATIKERAQKEKDKKVVALELTEREALMILYLRIEEGKPAFSLSEIYAGVWLIIALGFAMVAAYNDWGMTAPVIVMALAAGQFLFMYTYKTRRTRRQTKEEYEKLLEL